LRTSKNQPLFSLPEKPWYQRPANEQARTASPITTEDLLNIPDGGKKLGTQLDAATGLRLVASEQGVLVLIE
jgi:hypothetical protein